MLVSKTYVADRTSLEIQEEPAVAEVKMGIVAVRLHQLEQLGVQDLNKWAHICEIAVHAAAGRKIADHPFHQLAEAGEGHHLWNIRERKRE